MSGDDLDQLGRQVERASLFTHTALGRGFVRLRELESFVYGLIDALIARNVVTQDEIADAVASSATSSTRPERYPSPAWPFASPSRTRPPRRSSSTARPGCTSVTRSVASSTSFSRPARSRRGAKWDLGRPYLLRRESDGLCTHNERCTGWCGIYDDRPVPCQRYTCAHDERIWKDFEKMELNHEWLEENLSKSRPRLRHAMVVTPPVEPSD